MRDIQCEICGKDLEEDCEVVWDKHNREYIYVHHKCLKVWKEMETIGANSFPS
jgi:hypothetical protein